MIDIKFVRSAWEQVADSLARRGVARDRVRELHDLDAHWRAITVEVDKLRAEQNEANNRIAAAAPAEKKRLIEDMRTIAATLKEKEGELLRSSAERDDLWRALPNVPADDVPEGEDATHNVVLREVGEKPQFSFAPRPHWELGEALDVIDTERAARTTGSRFTYLKGDLALAQFALIQFALSTLTTKDTLVAVAERAGVNVPHLPFIPVIPPVFIRPEVFQRMARLEPRDDRYYIQSDDLYLIGSAEHTLGPLHMDEIFEETSLPRRYVGYSTSFRREAGSHGKDVRGILRVHQFDKLEIESFCLPEESRAEQDFIVALQEYLVQSLELPYRVVAICTGDMGDPDARQIDIETWLPGQDAYRETHTSDLITDYQARRLKTRVKRKDGRQELVHMNDATVFAIGRTLIALMENHQQEDGSIRIPEALHQYLPFRAIEKK